MLSFYPFAINDFAVRGNGDLHLFAAFFDFGKGLLPRGRALPFLGKSHRKRAPGYVDDRESVCLPAVIAPASTLRPAFVSPQPTNLTPDPVPLTPFMAEATAMRQKGRRSVVRLIIVVHSLKMTASREGEARRECAAGQISIDAAAQRSGRALNRRRTQFAADAALSAGPEVIPG